MEFLLDLHVKDDNGTFAKIVILRPAIRYNKAFFNLLFSKISASWIANKCTLIGSSAPFFLAI